MPLPSPQDLALAIYQTSLSQDQKQKILKVLPSLSGKQILELYEALLDLYRQETKFINEIKLVDLKYQVKVQSIIEEAKKSGTTPSDPVSDLVEK